jgi:hypothetical protein
VPLSSATTGEMANHPVPVTKTTQRAESASTKGDPVAKELAEPLAGRQGQPHVVAHEPRVPAGEEPPLTWALTDDPASHDDVGRSSPLDAHNPNRARGFLVVVVFVIVAGAVYWMSVNSTRPPDPQTVTGGAPTTAPEPASSALAAPPRVAITPRESPTVGTLPSTAGSSESPAAVRESTSPIAKARPSTAVSSESEVTISPRVNAEPPAAGRPPESAHAQMPSPAEATESPNRGTAETTTTKASATNETRRTGMRDQTKEQAQRDAIATQRLIARELADFPPAHSDDRSPPRP